MSIYSSYREGHRRDEREAQILALLEMLDILYTGIQVLALSLDKPMPKRLLWYYRLLMLEFQVFKRADDPIDGNLMTDTGKLRYSLFVKPSSEGTRIGGVTSIASCKQRMRCANRSRRC